MQAIRLTKGHLCLITSDKREKKMLKAWIKVARQYRADLYYTRDVSEDFVSPQGVMTSYALNANYVYTPFHNLREWFEITPRKSLRK